MNFKQVSKRIADDIEAYSVETFSEGHRWHLGASVIGRECSRQLWYLFRWCYSEKISGRTYRLFNRGHLEEPRYINYLEGIGFKVWYENYEGFAYHAESNSYCILTPGDNGDGLAEPILLEDPNFKMHLNRAKADGLKFPQFRISGVNGHFGGSMDGLVQFPKRYEIEGLHLVEFKTNSTGQDFTKLVTSGMQSAKPEHWAQACTYGFKAAFGQQLENVLYLNTNKNDDDMHIEFTKLDLSEGERMEAKAERIITSQIAPERISNNSTFFKCNYCAAKDICHKGALPEKNCRSCKHSKPDLHGEWKCNLYGQIIPRDFVKSGCDEYIPITNKT